MTVPDEVANEIGRLETERARAICETQKLRKTCDELIAMLNKERAAVAKFLVPHRRELAQCWLGSFVESGSVSFDEIGFVAASPVKLEDPQVSQNPTSGLGWYYDEVDFKLYCVFEVANAATDESGKPAPAGARFGLEVKRCPTEGEAQQIVKAFMAEPGQFDLPPNSLTPITREKYLSEYAD